MTVPHRRWRIVHSEASLGWGGQEHRVLAELAGFQKRGSDVWLLTPAKAEIVQRAKAAGVSCEIFDDTRWKFPLTVLQTAAWLRRIRPHVVNTHSSRDGWLVGLAARLARVPLVIRSRHIDVDYPHPWMSRHAFTTLADHVLTTSDKITAHFKELFGLPDDRISTVPTGIDLNRFQPGDARAALPIPEAAKGLPLVGMVSVLRSWKGHPAFFKAARILKDAGVRAHFVVVGGGAPVEYFENLAREAGVRERVTFTGHREDVPEILRALAVLAIPSTRHEGVPQIGLQALACGTPVVGSDIGGIPEIIRDGETGRIFPANDAAALAAKIREALEQVDETRRLAEQGRALVEAAHSFDAMLNKLDALYRRHLPE
ncbi:MAG: glycosyltransferase [Verrucomicrobia bacterium]|nr:glycosyltransferase [Verrucomicrobiota bacterium]